MSVLSLLALGSLILLYALDGLVCLLMAFPLAIALALLGTVLGRASGMSLTQPPAWTLLSIVACLFPLLVAAEHSTVKGKGPPVRTVTTSIRVDASIERVWGQVIAFPRIEEPPRGIFCCGIAYPIEARLEGKGVGATRYCTFSTGTFVEPITAWEAPYRLAFDVTENPPPMQELTLYNGLDVPHLSGHMVSQRGEFRLEEQEEHIILHGTTWYTHTLEPQFYWGLISDEIIHHIHRRVLEHIKQHAEQS